MNSIKMRFSAVFLSTLVVLILLLSACKKELYVSRDLSHLPADVASAATWYNDQIAPGSADTSFAIRNIPQWEKTSINKSKSNATFTTPISTDGDLNRKVVISYSEEGYRGKIIQYDKINKDLTKVSTYSINGRLMEEGDLYANGQYRLLRTVASSNNTMSMMGEESGTNPDDIPSGIIPETPYDAPQESIIDNGIFLEDAPPPSGSALRLIGRNNDRGNVEDLTFGTNSLTWGMDPVIVAYSTPRLFVSMGNLMSWGTAWNSSLRQVAERFVGIFGINTLPSNVFDDVRLNNAVSQSVQFKNFILVFGNLLRDRLIQENFMINNVSVIEMGSTRPIFGGTYNMFHGLTILLNDTEKTEIRLESFDLFPGNKWRAVVEVTIYDHFGLDRNDAMSKANYHEGFTAWWLLQHTRSKVPFVTKVVVRQTLANFN